jgi:hypothetical protein
MDAIRSLRRRTGRIKVHELLSARDEGRTVAYRNLEKAIMKLRPGCAEFVRTS